MAGRISDKRREQLDQFYQMTERVQAVIRNIKDGMPETQACREANIKVSAFRHHTAKYQYMENNIDGAGKLSQAEFSNRFLHPAETLYLMLVFENNNSVESVEDIPWGVEKSMEKVMHKALTKRQIKILRCWLWERMTIKDIAKTCGLTPNRINQIINKSMRLMRRPVYLRYLREGFAWAEKTNRIRMEKLEAIRREKREAIEKELEQEKARLDAPKSPVLETRIEDCPLSVRAHNALRRTNIKTLGDLEGRTEKDFRRIRNLGRKSIEELKAVYKEMVGKDLIMESEEPENS